MQAVLLAVFLLSSAHLMRGTAEAQSLWCHFYPESRHCQPEPEPTSSVPELDAAGAGPALLLLAGGAVLLSSRRRRR